MAAHAEDHGPRVCKSVGCTSYVLSFMTYTPLRLRVYVRISGYIYVREYHWFKRKRLMWIVHVHMLMIEKQVSHTFVNEAYTDKSKLWGTVHVFVPLHGRPVFLLDHLGILTYKNLYHILFFKAHVYFSIPNAWISVTFWMMTCVRSFTFSLKIITFK